MIGIIVVATFVACILVYLLFWRDKKEVPPGDSYVCDVCGEKHCICHKENEV